MHYLHDAYYRLHNTQLKLENEIRIRDKKEEKDKNKKLKERTELDFKSSLRSAYNAFLDMAMAIEESKELEMESKISPLIALSGILLTIEQRFQNVNTIDDLVSIIKLLTEPLDDWDNSSYSYFNYYNYNRDFRARWDSYSSNQASMSDRVGALISNAIEYPSHDVNVFDMHCRDNMVVPNIFDGHDNVRLYGLDTCKTLNLDQRKKYRRVVFGNLKGCVITNDSFDIAFCFPPLTRDKKMTAGFIVRNERNMLRKTGDFLKIGGTIVYGIPYYRFTRDICEYLVKNYEDLQVFTTNFDMEYGAKFVYVIGQKVPSAKTSEFNDEAFQKLRNLPLHYRDLIDMNPDALHKIKLSGKFVEVKRFRGSELNETEIEELYAASKCTASFWKDQSIEKLSESKARPLLPFNVGQLGLVLTSGCLDGIIEEGNGFKHAVKGRVIKRIDNIEQIDHQTNQIQVTSTVSNRVEINAFLPDGTYKCLA